MELNLVLVEPQIPQNTGNIARTCAATGAALHLVRPLGFEIDDKKLKRAGLDYWHLLNITYHDSLDAFLEYANLLSTFYPFKFQPSFHRLLTTGELNCLKKKKGMSIGHTFLSNLLR